MSLWSNRVRRRIGMCLVSAVSFFCTFFSGVPSLVHAMERPILAPQAKSAILMDAMTGTVLFAKNEHARLPIASVTKVATMLLISDALESGKVRLMDLVRTSEHAASMGGSQIFLEPGEQMTLQDMLKGIALASANDAAVAVAEHIAGSEQNFVLAMNERARSLNLHDTHFVNTNGLPATGHYSSAYDLAILSRELMWHESIVRYTGLYSDYLRKNTSKPFWLVNTNKLVRHYTGMDGIKTGFTADAKYCLAASAKRDHFRVIAIVLGEPTSKIRNAEIADMMNYAFSNYGTKMIYSKGQVVTLVPVFRGELQAVSVVAARQVGVLVNKSDGLVTGDVITELRPLVAPVKKGQLAGHIKVVAKGRVLTSVPVFAAADVAPVSWFEMMGRTMKSVLLLGIGSR